MFESITLLVILLPLGHGEMVSCPHNLDPGDGDGIGWGSIRHDGDGGVFQTHFSAFLVSLHLPLGRVL